MSLSNQESFDSFEIFYPVESGADGFLAQAQEHGLDVFGKTFATFITKDYSPEPDELEVVTQKVHIPTGPPRLKVYDSDDLRVTLLKRRAPVQMNYYGKFAHAEGRLLRKDDMVHKPLKVGGTKEVPEIMSNGEKRYHDEEGHVYRTSPIWDLLVQAGLHYDVMPDEKRPLVCQGLTSQIDPSTGNIELALIPAIESPVTKMLLNHARACVRGLVMIPSQKTAYPDSGPVSLDIPFASLPRDFYSEEAEAVYIKILNDELARRPVRLILGAIESRLQRGRRQPE